MSLPLCKVAFKCARSRGNNVAVTVCIQSDLMSLLNLILTVTFVCVIEAIGQLFITFRIKKQNHAF